jgi:hypothetical protein
MEEQVVQAVAVAEEDKGMDLSVLVVLVLAVAF